MKKSTKVLVVIIGLILGFLVTSGMIATILTLLHSLGLATTIVFSWKLAFLVWIVGVSAKWKKK